MVAIVVVAILGGTVATVFFLASRGGGSTSTSTLPTGCVKPSGGFLVIASKDGFNDSIDHGVPAKWWPLINVTQGQTVNITVCNTDFQAHGFQVAHYYDTYIVTVVPGQIVHVSFVANQAGKFRIYCNIFCSIHWAMQSGLLTVTSG